MNGQTKYKRKTRKQRFHKILRKSKTKSKRSRSRSRKNRIGGGNGRLRNWVPLAKLNWAFLCKNPSPNAIELLIKNPDKIDWKILSTNPAAIHLLEQNLDKIHWPWLSYNPAIFIYDYKQIAKHRWPINKEIIQNRFHPKNMKYFSGWGVEALDDYEE